MSSIVTMHDAGLLASNVVLLSWLLDRHQLEELVGGAKYARLALIVAVMWLSFGLEDVKRTIFGSVIVWYGLEWWNKQNSGDHT
jgi:hypothetical protein